MQDTIMLKHKYLILSFLILLFNINTAHAEREYYGWYKGGILTNDHGNDNSVQCYVPYNQTTTLTLRRDTDNKWVFWQIDKEGNEPSYTNNSDIAEGNTELIAWTSKKADVTVQVTINPSDIGKTLVVKTQRGPILASRAHDASFYIITASYMYGITYDYNGGNVDGQDSKTIDFTPSGSKDDTSYTISDVTAVSGYSQPVRAHYNFLGWDKTSVTITGKVNEWTRATVTAQWALYTYTVKFDANGGSGSMSDQGFTYDSAQNLNANQFSRTGYSFNGWNTKADGTGTSYSNTQFVSNLTGIDKGTVTLYAQWTPLYKYSLTYDTNGGQGGPGTVTSGSDWLTSNTYNFTISSTKPTWTGYAFTGWFDAKSGGNKVENSITVTGVDGNTASKTIYAQWSDLYKYTVTYDYNGGTKNGKSSTTEGLDWSDQTSFTIPYSHLYDKTIYPSKGNRILAGWYTQPSGGAAAFINEVSLAGIGHTEVTKTIYAIWCNNIVGSIDHNGTIENGSQCVKEWDSSKAMTFHPSTGYEITGVTEKIGTGSATTIAGVTFPMSSYTYPAGKKPDNEIAVNVTTTAITYTLTFNAGEGGSVSPSSKNYTIEDAIELPSATKTGYSFAGWKVTTAGGNWSTSDDVYSGTVSAGKYGNATLTAQWTINKYDVTGSIDNGGSVSNSSQKDIEYGNSSSVMVFKPATGYEISSIKVNGVSQTVSDKTGYTYPVQVVTNDVNVVVTTALVSYRVTYDANGTNVSGCPANLDYTIVSTSALAVPTRPGFGFNGWKATSTSEGSWTNGSSYEGGLSLTGKYGNVTLQAQWNEGEYTATFVANGGTVSPTSDSYKVTEQLALPVPVRKGYKFKGWKVTEAATGGNWSTDDALYTGSLAPEGKYGDVTLTAQWEAIPKGDLKITVKGLEDGDNAVITVVSETTGLEHAEYTISVQSSANTATIKNLYEGSYTVTSGGWQWKYTVSDTNPKTATVSKDVPAEVTFTLSAKSDLPKHDESLKVNVLSKE